MTRHVPFPHTRNAVRAGLTLFTAVSLLALSGGVALGTQTSPENKQTICHATDSNSNPYVVNTPAKSGDVSGHADHTGPVWSPNLAKHVKWGDIIPPFDYTDQTGDHHFPGLNWDSNEGKSFWFNGCKKPTKLTVSVLKTNNADGNATYSHSETSPTEAASVPFKVTVTNNNSVSIVIDSITDAVGATPVSFTCSPALVGTTLAPGDSATCSFTVASYSPADGTSKTNTATVNVHQSGDDYNTGTGSSTSVVTTSENPPPPSLSIDVLKTNNADGNTIFSGNETSPAPNSSVPFKVKVTNTSSVPVIIDTMTDAVGNVAVPFTCDVALVGLTLAPSGFATCAFTVTGYSPPDGDSKTNKVVITGHEGPHDDSNGNPENTVSNFDTSVVSTDVPTPPPAELSLTVVKTNNADGIGDYSPTETASGPGQNVPYKVVIKNTSGITVALDGLTDVVGGASPVPVTCNPALPSTLASQASATCFFTLAGSSPPAGSSLTDTVTARAHDPQDDDNDVSAQGSSTVLTASPPQPPPPPPAKATAPDLSIVKTGPAGSLLPGDDAGYTLTVSNDGDGAASSVVVDDALPANTTRLSITQTGWTCTGDAVHCVLNAPLGAGATASIGVVLHLAADYAASSVVNTATVSPTDGTPNDNTSTVTTPVSHAPDLAIVKTGPASVTAGDPISWTLTVTNDGDASAATVTVTDTLPDGLDGAAVTAPGWTCTGTTSLSCTLNAALAAGGTAGLTISATVPVTYTGATVSNTAVVGPADATPDDNTSTVVTTVTLTSTGGGGITVPGVSKPPAVATGGGGQLAFTGVALAEWTLEGLALLLFGSGLVLMGRRKHTVR